MTTTPAERAAIFERILSPALKVLADRDGDPAEIAKARHALAEVTRLIDMLHGIPRDDPPDKRSPDKPEPHDARVRARKKLTAAEATRVTGNGEREAEGLQGLRKGRRQCEATTRKGTRCKAPAVPSGSVCRRHGGAAPQVRVSAAMMRLYEARFAAGQAWEAARGTAGEFDALCAWSRADNAVKEAEKKVERIRELRAELRRQRKAPPAISQL